MNKMLKTILILSIAAFSVGFLLVLPTDAQTNELVVEYWTGTEWKPLVGPLFEETNFLPGQNVTRLVRVTNNSGQLQRIATEAINKNDPNRLGDVLNLEIKEGGTKLYNNALSKFFTEGEVYLSNLAGGKAQTQYDFIVTFYSGAKNPFQGKSLNFDILVGFQGEEGGILPGAGGGGGGFLPPGLTIIEPVSVSGVTTATITWQTSYESTSRVVYGTSSGQFSLSAGEPSYGYEFYSDEDSIKTKNHLITLTGLTSGTTYYYRCVSHGSLAISTEYSFTTLGVEVEEVEEEVEPVQILEEIETGKKGESSYVPLQSGTTEGKEEKEEIGGLEGPELVEVGVKEPTGLGRFLAAVGAFPFSPKVILIIVALILIVLIILWLFKKKKNN